MTSLLKLSPEEITQFLEKHGRMVNGLRLKVRDGRVEIDGEVASFYHKQLVLRDALDKWGAARIRFQITVQHAEAGTVPVVDAE